MRARLLRDCFMTLQMGLKVGDEGVLIENGMPEKYAACIDFGPLPIPEAERTGFFAGMESIARHIYLYEGEFEVLS